VEDTHGGEQGGRTGKVRVKSRLNRSIVWASLGSVVLFVMGALMMGGMVPAHAAEPVQISVSASANGTSVVVSGAVRTLHGQGLPGLLISFYLDNYSGGTTATLSDGSFSYSMNAPSAGSHTVRAQWSGDVRYSPAAGTASVSVPHAQTSMSLTLDPAEVVPGSPVSVTGSLTSGGAPISSALVSLNVDYGSVDPIVSTGGDGGFVAGLTIPDDAGFPATFTVTANFQGDNLYASASGRAVGSIAAPPAPPAEEQNDGAIPAAPITMPALTSEASPTSGIMNVPSDSSNEGSASPMAIVSIIFFAVALVSVGTLVILGIVSHAQKRLGRDERRGFGTTFGKLG